MAQDMNTTGPPKSGRMPRWIKIAFGLSLAANLAVIGIVSGVAFRGEPKGPRPSGVSGYAGAYIKALPHADRRSILDEVRKSGDARGLSRPERRALFDDMLAALRAPELDRAAVNAVLSQQQAASLGLQSNVQEEWLNLVSKMNLEERRAYADAVQGELDRKRGPKKGGKP